MCIQRREPVVSKVRINLSIDADTLERLRQYAWENHSTVSKAVTDLVWDAKVKNVQIRGQMNLSELDKTGRKRKRVQAD